MSVAGANLQIVVPEFLEADLLLPVRSLVWRKILVRLLAGQGRFVGGSVIALLRLKVLSPLVVDVVDLAFLDLWHAILVIVTGEFYFGFRLLWF